MSSSFIPDFELGALAWVNQNSSYAIKKKLFTYDVVTEPGQLMFCVGAGISHDHILQLALSVKGKGYSRRYNEKEQSAASDFSTWVYRRSQDWMLLDGTVPSSLDDEALRTSRGLTWNHNSCAIDTALMISIILQIGRLRCDIVAFRRQDQLSDLARLLRQLVRAPWGLMPQADRDGLRDILRRALAAADPTKYPLNSYLGIQSILDDILAGAGQLSWTETKVKTCCDGETRPSGASHRRSSLELHLSIDGTPVGAQINRVFQRKVSESVKRRCSRGPECIKSATVQDRILLDDELPPRLLIHLRNSITYGTDEVYKPFQPFKLTCPTIDAARSKQYQAFAAVFVVDNNHFICRWKADASSPPAQAIHTFDGGRFGYVGNWWHGLRREHTVRRERPKAKSYSLEEIKALEDLPRLVSVVFEAPPHNQNVSAGGV